MPKNATQTLRGRIGVIAIVLNMIMTIILQSYFSSFGHIIPGSNGKYRDANLQTFDLAILIIINRIMIITLECCLLILRCIDKYESQKESLVSSTCEFDWSFDPLVQNKGQPILLQNSACF